MRIEILNWEKYNPRKDVKAPSWFRLSHGLFEDHEFYDFTNGELLSWIYLLSLASKKSSPIVYVNFRHLEMIGKIKHRDFSSAVEKLKRNQCISAETPITSRVRHAHDTHTGATLHNEHNMTNITILTDSPADESRRHFDFGPLYMKYPRKEGKLKGMTMCKTQIRTPEDLALLSKAIDRYAKHCSEKGTEPKYIKHFATFMSSWRDWLDPEVGTVSIIENIPAWKLEAMEEERAQLGTKPIPDKL